MSNPLATSPPESKISHDARVDTLSAAVRDFQRRGKKFRIYHGSTNSTRTADFQRDQIIDTSGLRNVLALDTERKAILVEPNVPMDDLVNISLKYGLVPPVVMEFPGITVGGGYAGTSGESSSFKYGLFERTVLWVEIVLASGDVVTASASEREDLWRGARSSYGTLGVTTLLEVQLIDAKPYVQLSYHPVFSVAEAVKRIRAEIENPSNDFIDGILFTKKSGVVMTGRLVDRTPALGAKLQRFTRAADPWFYLHAQRRMSQSSEPCTDIIPVTDYLFRYDRGGFWTGKYAFLYFMVPFIFLMRWLLDAFMHTRVMYHALHQSGHTDRYIVQDISMPYKRAEEFVNYVDANFGLYPLWLCPVKLGPDSALRPRACHQMTDKNMLNIGVWGPGPTNGRRFTEINRKFEQRILELNGLKCLYAQTYYTEEEFWELYDRKSYESLRSKYHASSLPTIYDKVKPNENTMKRSWIENRSRRIPDFVWRLWPVSGIYGVWKTTASRDYLLAR
ncbi:MAG: hypothetical protein Q9165_004019 [Trypethelium subeluteriae]